LVNVQPSSSKIGRDGKRGESMPQYELIAKLVRQLNAAAGKLALIGAALKIGRGAIMDSEIADLIRENITLILGDATDTLNDQETSILIDMVEMGLAEAAELLKNPCRSGEWRVADSALLQAQGRVSGQVFQRICALAADRPLLGKALNGRFLDVGTGVAGIALEAAKARPSLTIQGIDIWEPALNLALENVRNSPYSDRISIRRLNITELPAEPRYTLIWLPTMFMRRTVVEAALDRIAAASLKDAYVIASCYTVPSDRDAAAFVALRILRSGGERIEHPEIEKMLSLRGFINVESDVSPLATFTLGCRV
jgi:hypothetical protein